MRSLSLALLAILLTAPAADAQARFGLGVTANPIVLLSPSGEDFGGLYTVYVPITFAQFRLEPEVGFARSAISTDDESFSQSSTRLGAGAFYLVPAGGAGTYFGARVAFDLRSEDGPGDDESATDTYFIPAVGGEHLFGEHFSLGLEVQLPIGFLDTGVDDVDRTTITTRGLVVARWHF